MISDAVIVALITGACTVTGQLIISAKTTSELFAKLDKQSEIADEKMRGEIAVLRTELSDLSKKVEKHNNMVERTYKLETQVARQDEQIKALFNNQNKTA